MARKSTSSKPRPGALVEGLEPTDLEGLQARAKARRPPAPSAKEVAAKIWAKEPEPGRVYEDFIKPGGDAYSYRLYDDGSIKLIGVPEKRMDLINTVLTAGAAYDAIMESIKPGGVDVEETEVEVTAREPTDFPEETITAKAKPDAAPELPDVPFEPEGSLLAEGPQIPQTRAPVVLEEETITATAPEPEVTPEAEPIVGPKPGGGMTEEDMAAENLAATEAIEADAVAAAESSEAQAVEQAAADQSLEEARNQAAQRAIDAEGTSDIVSAEGTSEVPLSEPDLRTSEAPLTEEFDPKGSLLAGGEEIPVEPDLRTSEAPLEEPDLRTSEAPLEEPNLGTSEAPLEDKWDLDVARERAASRALGNEEAIEANRPLAIPEPIRGEAAPALAPGPEGVPAAALEAEDLGAQRSGREGMIAEGSVNPEEPTGVLTGEGGDKEAALKILEEELLRLEQEAALQAGEDQEAIEAGEHDTMRIGGIEGLRKRLSPGVPVAPDGAPGGRLKL